MFELRFFEQTESSTSMAVHACGFEASAKALIEVREMSGLGGKHKMSYILDAKSPHFRKTGL
jgi:hypothetical protein